MAAAWIKAGALAWLEGAPETRRLDTPIFGHPADGCEPLYNQAALDAAVAAEREACAKLCEENCAGYQYGKLGAKPVLSPFYKECGGRHEGMTYASAIRARGEQAKEGVE